MSIRILHGDCRAVMASMGEASVDAIVTDPPYELGFMGKGWDRTGIANDVGMWREALRVLKPGGHLLAFSGTRTYHRMVCAIEDAGFEVRDQLGWLYGSGFPKSLNLGKCSSLCAPGERCSVTEDGACDAAAMRGWGTALKPAWEPIVLARKPFVGTVAANVLAHGTGALNIDGCRVAADDGYTENAVTQGVNTARTSYAPAGVRRTFEPQALGRWPVIHDGSDEVLAAFPQTDSVGHTPAARGRGGLGTSGHAGQLGIAERHHDTGSAARFFYTAKASASERTEGLHTITARGRNHHPTVKPTDLMRYLCRLITPPGGTVLDPFMGSGSTLKAAELEGFNAIGIELDPAYIEIARRRIASDAPLFREVFA